MEEHIAYTSDAHDFYNISVNSDSETSKPVKNDLANEEIEAPFTIFSEEIPFAAPFINFGCAIHSEVHENMVFDEMSHLEFEKIIADGDSVVGCYSIPRWSSFVLDRGRGWSSIVCCENSLSPDIASRLNLTAPHVVSRLGNSYTVGRVPLSQNQYPQWICFMIQTLQDGKLMQISEFVGTIVLAEDKSCQVVLTQAGERDQTEDATIRFDLQLCESEKSIEQQARLLMIDHGDQTSKLFNIICHFWSFIHTLGNYLKAIKNDEDDIWGIYQYRIFTSKCKVSSNSSNRVWRRKSKGCLLTLLRRTYNTCLEQHSTNDFNLPEISNNMVKGYVPLITASANINGSFGMSSTMQDNNSPENFSVVEIRNRNILVHFFDTGQHRPLFNTGCHHVSIQYINIFRDTTSNKKFVKDRGRTFQFNRIKTYIIFGVSSLPWLVKPLYGFVSDLFPLFSRRRRSYLVISGLLGALSRSLMATFVEGKYGVACCMLLGSIYVVFSDEVVDSMIGERARGESHNMPWSLQSICCGFSDFGGFISSYLRGSLVDAYGVMFFFGSIALLPLISSAIADPFNEQLVLMEPTAMGMPWFEDQMMDIFNVAVFIYLWGVNHHNHLIGERTQIRPFYTVISYFQSDPFDIMLPTGHLFCEQCEELDHGNQFARTANSSLPIHFDKISDHENMKIHTPGRLLQTVNETQSKLAAKRNTHLKVKMAEISSREQTSTWKIPWSFSNENGYRALVSLTSSSVKDAMLGTLKPFTPHLAILKNVNVRFILIRGKHRSNIFGTASSLLIPMKYFVEANQSSISKRKCAGFLEKRHEDQFYKADLTVALGPTNVFIIYNPGGSILQVRGLIVATTVLLSLVLWVFYRKVSTICGSTIDEKLESNWPTLSSTTQLGIFLDWNIGRLVLVFDPGGSPWQGLLHKGATDTHFSIIEEPSHYYFTRLIIEGNDLRKAGYCHIPNGKSTWLLRRARTGVG